MTSRLNRYFLDFKLMQICNRRKHTISAHFTAFLNPSNYLSPSVYDKIIFVLKLGVFASLSLTFKITQIPFHWFLFSNNLRKKRIENIFLANTHSDHLFLVGVSISMSISGKGANRKSFTSNSFFFFFAKS